MTVTNILNHSVLPGLLMKEIHNIRLNRSVHWWKRPRKKSLTSKEINCRESNVGRQVRERVLYPHVTSAAPFPSSKLFLLSRNGRNDRKFNVARQLSFFVSSESMKSEMTATSAFSTAAKKFLTSGNDMKRHQRVSRNFFLTIKLRKKPNFCLFQRAWP